MPLVAQMTLEDKLKGGEKSVFRRRLVQDHLAQCTLRAANGISNKKTVGNNRILK